MKIEEAIEYNKNLREYMRIIDKDSECKFLKENYEALDMAIKSLEQTKWIPVNEKLPEDYDLILFSTKTEVFEGRYFDDNTDRQWYSFRDDTFAWNNVVTAWMPLPQPYKAESEEA
jgi:hypothetical protein